MKTTVNRWIAIGGLVALLGTTTATGLLAQNSVPPSGVVLTAAKAKKEGHPELRRALAALQRAKTALQNASRDFGGHRTKAVEHVDEAISEVNAAMASDQK